MKTIKVPIATPTIDPIIGTKDATAITMDTMPGYGKRRTIIAIKVKSPATIAPITVPLTKAVKLLCMI